MSENTTEISEMLSKLFEEIKHGDKEHQSWLKDKIATFQTNYMRHDVISEKLTGEEEIVLTYGEKAAGIKIGQIEEAEVSHSRRLIAELINLMYDIKVSEGQSEKARQASIAITDLETAQMRIIKALT